MGEVGDLFVPAASLPVPPVRKRMRSLRYRAASREKGRQLLRERGVEYYAAIGRAGGHATARKPKVSVPMQRIVSALPPDVCDMLQQQSVARGVSMSGLVREYVLQGLGVALQSDKPAKGKKKRG